MLKESILGKLLIAVFALFKTFNSTFTYKVLSGIKNFIVRIFKGSFIYRILKKEDNIQNYAKRSGMLKFIDRTLIGIITFFSSIYKKLRKINIGSLNNRIYNFFNKKSYFSFQNILAFTIVLITIVPGNKWNNLYGLILAVLMLGLYFVTLISGKAFSYRTAKFDFIMLIFMFASVMGVLVSYAVADSIRVFMFFVTSFIFMITISGSVKTKEELHKFVGIISIGLILTSLYCIYQGIVGVEIDVRLTDISTNQGMPGRAYSTFENPNNYAEYLVMFMPFLAAFALNQKSKGKKVIFLFALMIPFAALLYTYSRSCWVSFAISFLVFICFYNYRLIPLMLLLGFMMIPFLPETIINRISTIGSMKDTSNKYRILIWEGVLKMLKGTFVTGIGLGPEAFNKLYPSYADASAVLAPHSHMLFMQVLTEMGLLGFISFLSYWVMTLKRLVTTKIRYKLPYEMKNYVCASLASFTGVIFVSGVEYIWFYPRVMISFFVMVGIIMATLKISKKCDEIKD